jgi:hypothetical protein
MGIQSISSNPFVPTAKLLNYMDLSMYDYLMRLVHAIYKSTPRKEVIKNEVHEDNAEDDGRSTAHADGTVVLARTCATSLANILRLYITDEHSSYLIGTLTEHISLTSDYYMDATTAVMGRSIVSTRSLPISRQKASFSNI